jgi:hypothetical protein
MGMGRMVVVVAADCFPGVEGKMGSFVLDPDVRPSRPFLLMIDQSSPHKVVKPSLYQNHRYEYIHHTQRI